MADYGDYAKYVVQHMWADAPLPPMPAGTVTNMTYLDGNTIPGAFNVICAWFEPRTEPLVVIPNAHTHDTHEVVCFYGTNPDDYRDLCGEIEMYLEDQKITITKSGLVYIPAGMSHSPLTIIRADRPIFHFSAVTESEWIMK